MLEIRDVCAKPSLSLAFEPLGKWEHRGPLLQRWLARSYRTGRAWWIRIAGSPVWLSLCRRLGVGRLRRVVGEGGLRRLRRFAADWRSFGFRLRRRFCGDSGRGIGNECHCSVSRGNWCGFFRQHFGIIPKERDNQGCRRITDGGHSQE